MKFNINVLLFLVIFAISSLDTYACQEDDYVALRALYLSTDGDNWNNNEGWLTNANFMANPTMPAGTNVDTWYGITTNDDGCVICIDMDGGSSCSSNSSGSNNLVGNIPAEIGNLVHLEKLILSRNQLMGNIPIEIGNLSNLVWLYLNSNKLDNIPPEIGSLNKLEYLHLSNNELSGGIPSEIGNLNNLSRLLLDRNPQIGGNIPPEIGNLINLTILALINNGLIGSIPSEIGNLNKLLQLYLHENALMGSIPAEIGNLDNLIFLTLYNNQLSGCYHVDLISLCTQSSYPFSNADISDGNNFDASWETFCANGAGTCDIVDVINTQQNTFTVYPIPAKDVVIFDIPNIAAADELILYDISGKQISRQAFPQDKQLTVSHLNDGVYIYRIFYEDEVYSGKIVVE